MFGLNPERGLAHLLRREADLESVAVTVFRMSPHRATGRSPPAASGDPRAGGRIDIVAHGEHVASPVALLSSAAMSELFATAAATYDLVIVDTSPVLTVSDAVPLLSEVGAVLFVARLGVTTRDAAERLTELAERVPDMNLVGVVVNDMRGKYPGRGLLLIHQVRRSMLGATHRPRPTRCRLTPQTRRSRTGFERSRVFRP